LEKTRTWENLHSAPRVGVSQSYSTDDGSAPITSFWWQAPCDSRPAIFLNWTTCVHNSLSNILSDDRIGSVVYMASGHRQRSHSQVESRGTHDNIWLSQIRESPNLEGQVHVFTISSRSRVAQLHPQALGSLFVASYDSQGYSGGIRLRGSPLRNLASFIVSFLPSSCERY
jgi:hypothetical protein